MTASTATLRSSGARRRGGTPLLLALGLTLFASVSTELLPPALILGMSSTLGVDAAAVGALVTVWAVTIVVGTVPAVRLTRRLPRRALLTASLLLFAAATLVVALVPSFAVVVAARIVSALAAAVSWSVVFAFVPRLVPEERLGRAMAVALVAGGTIGDRFPDGTLLVLVATIAAGAVLLAASTSAGPAIAGAVALGFGIGGLPPVFQARIARTASPAFRDLAVSLFVVILNVGIAAGSATGAAILGAGGLGTLAVAASALAVAALLAFALTLAVTRRASRR